MTIPYYDQRKPIQTDPNRASYNYTLEIVNDLIDKLNGAIPSDLEARLAALEAAVGTMRTQLTAGKTLYVRTEPIVSTVTIASPAVVTQNGHGLAADAAFVWSTSGALPTGLLPGVIYYVVGASITANTFQLSATPGGAAINTSGSQSGTHWGQTGSDDNDGSDNTKEHALLSMQEAWDTFLVSYDLRGFVATIQLAAGQYNEGLLAVGRPVGLRGGQYINLIGDVDSPSSCLIVNSGVGTAAIAVGTSAAAPASLRLQGVELRATGGGGNSFCVECHDGSQFLFNSITFGPSPLGIHIYCHTGGYVLCGLPGYNISGEAAEHVLAAMNATVIIHGVTVVFSNAPAIGCYIMALKEALVVCDGCTFTNGNTVTGQRFLISEGGCINTGTDSLTYLPGTIAGDFDSGYYNGKLGFVHAQAFRTIELLVGDDQAVSLDMMNDYGRATSTSCHLIFQLAAGVINSGLMRFMVDLANNPVMVAGDTTSIDFSNVVLTGTTGADGRMTVSSFTDGKFYIENRLGLAQIINITLF